MIDIAALLIYAVCIAMNIPFMPSIPSAIAIGFIAGLAVSHIIGMAVRD